MKKAYMKPGIYFEPVNTSSNLSSGCEGIANLAENQCSVTVSEGDEVMEIFGIEGICPWTPDNPESQMCYHAPTEWNNVYSS